MIRVTLFCTLRESENTRTCESENTLTCENRMSVCFLTRALTTRNMQKRATKSDASGHCLLQALWAEFCHSFGRSDPSECLLTISPRLPTAATLEILTHLSIKKFKCLRFWAEASSGYYKFYLSHENEMSIDFAKYVLRNQ